MGTDEHFANKAEELKGSAKETAGRVTGDRETEGEGKAEKLKAKAKDAVEGAREKMAGFAEGLKDNKKP